ncbi:translocation/assembly module TamB, partial [Sphingobacterium shayense]|uniref:translocation/assembly module TamB domain-containing protein n=1 Tax=Sphingobacterium shayense TaxID=626343 RepID=UPI001555411F
KGGLSGFDANMSLITEQGNATFNGNLSMAQDTTYDAYVSIDNFNVGSLLNQDSLLGYISANATVQGSGLDPKNMVANVQGDLNLLQAMGYDYHDIKLELSADQGDITGSLNSPDPNVKLNMDFHADMRGQYPKLLATLNIDTINFKNLNIIEDNFRYQGKVVADLETADLDFLNGSLVISNSSIAYNEERYTLDSVALLATADTSRNSLILESGLLSAHMVGKYKLTELGASVQDIIRMYYNPAGTAPTDLNYEPQNFEFSATLRNSPFIREFLPKLEELQNVTLDGTFNSEDKSFMSKLVAPKILYDGMRFENIGVDITTADSTLYYSALIEKINVSNLELSNTIFSGSAKENNLDFGLWIKDKLDKEQYHLGANMTVDQNNYTLKLHEDGLMLNYETWQISPDNYLSFGTNGISAQNFRLSNDGQELLLQSADSTLNAPLDLTFTNFRIETLSEILKSETLNLGGGINGTATISRLESKPVFISDVNIDKFYFGSDTVGNVLIKVDNVRENTFAADIKIVENGNDVHLVGDFISPPNGTSTLDATLSLNPMKMTTIQAFSMGYIKGSAGDLKGDLKITGTLDQPQINGDLTFDDAKINVAMLNADLMLDNQVIRFNNQGILFRQFEIKDLRGNTAKLNGTVRTKTYTDFDFNLNLSTNDFAAVNSTREDNDLFFGKLFITSNIRITGNLDHPRIDGNVKANNKTDFVFIVPNDDPGIAQREGVVKFVDRSDTARTNAFARLDSLTTASRLSGYDIALNLTTDRDAKFKVILDEGTKDALNIQGIAQINTTIDASDKITMSGTYTVERGDYTFSLGPISKEFTFQKGSTITWNGDPLDARLDITAIYTNRFSTLELVQSQIGSESQNLYKQRVPFDVKLILTGELFKPNINFDIDLDETNAIVSQDVVSKVNIALANIRDDQAELNKQVFSLLTLGRFMSSNPFESLAGGGAEGFARNTVSSFLTNQLNSMASDLIKGVELDFNLQSEEDYLTGNAETRTDLNVGISKMLFDDRLKVTIGSNFEVEGNSRPGEKSTNIASDISLEYQLSKDGRYFARVYRKNQYQATLQGQFVETGIGFIINMSYDKFKELFMNSKALEQYYDTDSRGFQRRFDIDRMNVDSAYRDSVRTVIRDSLIQNNPSFRKRWEERQREAEQLKQGNDSTTQGRVDSTQAIIPKEEEIPVKTEEEEKENDNSDSTDNNIEPKAIRSDHERSKDEF